MVEPERKSAAEIVDEALGERAGEARHDHDPRVRGIHHSGNGARERDQRGARECRAESGPGDGAGSADGESAAAGRREGAIPVETSELRCQRVRERCGKAGRENDPPPRLERRKPGNQSRQETIRRDVFRAAPRPAGLRRAPLLLLAIARLRSQGPDEEEAPENGVGAPSARRQDPRSSERPGDRSRERDGVGPVGGHRQDRVDREREPYARSNAGARGGNGRRNPREEERRRRRRHQVVVEAGPDGLQKREESRTSHEHRDRFGLERARGHEAENEDAGGSAEGPVRDEADPRLLAIPGEARSSDESSGNRSGRVAESHHRPDRRGDRKIAVAEENDQDEHHRGIRHDAGVAPGAGVPVDAAAEPREQEEVEEESRQGDGGRGFPVEPAQG